jgi:hypothetical protein
LSDDPVPGLPLEARADLGARREVLRQHLHGDVPAETGVAGAVDLAHAAGPEGLEDLIGVQTCVRG